MSFSYVIGSDVGNLRFIVGDSVQATAKFQDEELTQIMALEFGSLRLAAADCYDAMAARLANQIVAEDVELGDFKVGVALAGRVKALLDLAESLRQLEYSTPAFAIAEENLSPYNEVQIIRNWIQRNLLP